MQFWTNGLRVVKYFFMMFTIIMDMNGAADMLLLPQCQTINNSDCLILNGLHKIVYTTGMSFINANSDIDHGMVSKITFQMITPLYLEIVFQISSNAWNPYV